MCNRRAITRMDAGAKKSQSKKLPTIPIVLPNDSTAELFSTKRLRKKLRRKRKAKQRA